MSTCRYDICDRDFHRNCPGLGESRRNRIWIWTDKNVDFLVKQMIEMILDAYYYVMLFTLCYY